MTEQRIDKWTFRSHRTFFSTFRKYGKNEGTNQNSNLRMHTNAKVSTAYYGGTWGGASYYRVARLGMEARSGVQQLSTLVPDLRFTNLSLLASMKSPSRSFLWCQVVSKERTLVLENRNECPVSLWWVVMPRSFVVFVESLLVRSTFAHAAFSSAVRIAAVRPVSPK